MRHRLIEKIFGKFYRRGGRIFRRDLGEEGEKHGAEAKPPRRARFAVKYGGTGQF